MAVYQTYINAMNEKIRKQIGINNPFVFKHISNLKNMDEFDDIGPCVVMARFQNACNLNFQRLNKKNLIFKQ